MLDHEQGVSIDRTCAPKAAIGDAAAHAHQPPDAHIAYAAGPNVRLCFDAGDAIILDLRHNRYSAVAGAGRAPDAEGRFSNTVSRRFGVTPELERIERGAPVAELTCAARPKPQLSFGAWIDFGIACGRAAFDLRRGRLDLVLARMKRRRGALRQPCAPEALQARLELFVAMRPWWPRQRKCLFEAIALSEFLHAAGISADIVFAVRARAFLAHCWLERVGMVLNDDLERCQGYRAICWS